MNTLVKAAVIVLLTTGCAPERERTAKIFKVMLGTETEIVDASEGPYEDTPWKTSKSNSFCASYGRYVLLTRENTDGSLYVKCNSKYGDEVALHADVTKTRVYQKL